MAKLQHCLSNKKARHIAAKIFKREKLYVKREEKAGLCAHLKSAGTSEVAYAVWFISDDTGAGPVLKDRCADGEEPLSALELWRSPRWWQCSCSRAVVDNQSIYGEAGPRQSRRFIIANPARISTHFDTKPPRYRSGESAGENSPTETSSPLSPTCHSPHSWSDPKPSSSGLRWAALAAGRPQNHLAGRGRGKCFLGHQPPPHHRPLIYRTAVSE